MRSSRDSTQNVDATSPTVTTRQRFVRPNAASAHVDATSPSPVTSTVSLVPTPAVAKASVERPIPSPRQITGRDDLPSWNTTDGFTPNVFIRSALFGCYADYYRRLIVRDRDGNEVPDATVTVAREIYTSSQYSVTYKGEPLDQDDMLVFLLCLDQARNYDRMGVNVPISLRDFNGKMGKTTTGPTNSKLWTSLQRLSSGRLQVTGKMLAGGDETMLEYLLVAKRVRNERQEVTGYTVRINPEMAPLFENDMTRLNICRMAGLRSNLAKWLHGFYSSHNGKKAYSIEQLCRLSGATQYATKLYKFRYKLREALKELTQGPQPLFTEATIDDNDLLIVVKAEKSDIIWQRNPGPDGDVATEVLPYTPKESTKVSPAILTPNHEERASKAVREARQQRAKVAL